MANSGRVKGKTGEKTQDRYTRFAREYIIDFNATRAAIAVGYSEKTAAQQGSRLLNNAKVQEIKEKLLEDPIGRKNEIRARVLSELEAIAYDPNAVEIRTNSDGEVLEVSRKDKLKACELLGRHAGLFVDKKEISGSLTITPETVELLKDDILGVVNDKRSRKKS